MTAKMDSRPAVRMQDLLVTIDGGTGSGQLDLAVPLGFLCKTNVMDSGRTVRALALLAWEKELFQHGRERKSIQLRPKGVATITDWFTSEKTRPRFVEGVFRDGAPHVFMGRRDVTRETIGRSDNFMKRYWLEKGASILAANADIRALLYNHWEQTLAGWGYRGVVVGRRTGLDLFPARHASVFLTVSPSVAASMRFERGAAATSSLKSETRYITQRDGRDGKNGLLERGIGSLAIDMTPFLKKQDFFSPLDKLFNHLGKRYRIV